MTNKEPAAVSFIYIFILNFAVPKRFVDFLFREFESSLAERESIVVIVFGDVLKYANRYGTFVLGIVWCLGYKNLRLILKWLIITKQYLPSSSSSS